MEFTKPLEDQTVEEEATVTLECEVSRENADVRWFREGQELRKTKKYDMIVDGRKRALIIHDCMPDDAKMYTCDAKEFKTSCFLEVTRKDKNVTVWCLAGTGTELKIIYFFEFRIELEVKCKKKVSFLAQSS